ncbi:urea transporter [Kaistia algarum]|uniref:urea transporter n=1 Tax=Kaistia algarum TaxID=2083279 RepID=UPI000CE7D8F8|nr:urea transporter [Kaistia algarum]MCX5515290.1 urea transporter [Kaistia algarum]PPE77695.1 urea transporter [Kaistia algarum]
MENALKAWERAAAASGPLRFVDICLRGVGQVMFQDNPLTGAIFLLAIGWGSWLAGMPQVWIGGLVAIIIATATAIWLRVEEAPLKAGLYGYNGVLVGLALPTFLPATPLLWLYIALGAVVSVVAMLATARAGKPFGIVALTFPFVLVTWLMLLASHGFAGVAAAPTAIIVSPIVESDPLNLVAFLGGVFKSISQVFLKGSIVTALLLLVGLAVNSVPAALFALGGAVVAVLFAHLFGAESDLITGGLFGFSPILTAIALGTVFNKPSPRVIVYALVGTLFTVVAQAATNAALAPLAIPSLTAPFVLTSWLFLLPDQRFDQKKA